MSRELNFDGWWEGEVCYQCDCPGCRAHLEYPFTSEAEAKDYKGEGQKMRAEGWVTTKVNGQYRHFCSYEHRDRFIRLNTL